MTPGEQRKKERQARGLTLSQMALLDGVSRQAIWYRERATGGKKGRPKKYLDNSEKRT